ncbi:MAG: efflux RND transporter periplasmic adaptor subunit [Anaerolineaceae bacterium]|nr:efflux RND transporter periplasmic adaptor subunit [Anaerolineaceae bacterium]
MIKTKRFAFIIILVTGMIYLSGCDKIQNSGESQDTENVLIAPVTRNTHVISEGILVPNDFSHLSFQANGEVSQILVEEGQDVSTGEIIARLGDREPFEAQLKAAELELLNAQKDKDELLKLANLESNLEWQNLLDAKRAVLETQQALDEFDEDDYDDDVEDAEEKVADRKTDLGDAEDDLENYLDLDEDNDTRKRYEDKVEDAELDLNEAERQLSEIKIEYEQLKKDLAAAEAVLEYTQNEYELKKNSPDPDDLNLADATISLAQAHVAAAQAALDNLEIKAPFNGTIVDLDIILNENISAGIPVVLIADFSKWYVETDDLTEIEVVKIETGQVVNIEPDALPGETLQGKVEMINKFSEKKEGDVTYTTRILVGDFDLPLRWGMSMIVTFLDE